VAGVLVAPSFIDWEALKPRIIAKLSQETGRTVEIDGAIGLSMLPRPALSVEKVRLGNIEGGSEPFMADLAALDVEVSFWPLLEGRLQVRRVVLIEPRLLLEVLPDGRRNWNLAAADTAIQNGNGASEEKGDGDGDAGLDVALDSVSLRDGLVIYRNALESFEEQVALSEVQITAESLRGPFAGEGRVALRGQPLDIRLVTGELVAEGAIPVKLTLALPEAEAASFRYQGSISRHGRDISLRGGIKLAGDDLGELLAALPGGGARLPAALAQSFEIESKINYSGDRLVAEELSVGLGELSARGEASLRFGEMPDLRLALAAQQFDLDALLSASSEEAGEPAQEGNGQSDDQAGESPGGFALPDSLTGTAQFEIGTLVYRGQVVRQSLISMVLADGRLLVDQALALLPGGADLALTGTLTAAEGEPHFAGRVEATADNLRALLNWFDIDATAIPSHRLRRMVLTTRVEATPRAASLAEIDLELDVSRVSGGVALVFGERLGLGVGLAVDQINLDAYLPQGAVGDKPEDSTAVADQADDDAEAPAARLPAPLAQALGAVDANLEVTLGRLGWRGQQIDGAALDATLQNGALTLRRLSVDDFAGATAALTGSLDELAADPRIEQGRLELQVADSQRFGRALGLPSDSALARLGGFQATAEVSGSLEALSYKVALDALSGRLAGSGLLGDIAGAPTISDGRLDVERVTGADVARLLGLSASSPLARLGAISLGGTFAGSRQALSYDGWLHAGGAEISAKGRAEGLDADAPRIAAAVTARHPEPADFLAAVLKTSPLAPGIGALELQAEVGGGPTQVTLDALSGRLGDSEFAGTASVSLAGAVPAVTVDLTTGALPLDDWLASGRGDEDADDGDGRRAGEAARWSPEPLDLAALSALDAEVKLQAESLSRRALHLDGVVMAASLRGGVLDLQRLTGRIHNGSLSLKGRFDAAQPRRGLDAAVSLNLIEVDLGRVLREHAEVKRVSGPATLLATLTSLGRSEAELVRALAGNGRIEGHLTVEAKAEEQVGSLVLGVLGDKVREVRGLADVSSTMLSAFAGAPSLLTGSFTVERGVVTTEDGRLAGRGAVAQIRGTLADLPAWRTDLSTVIYRTGDPTPYLRVGLSGPLDRPNTRVAGQPFQRQPSQPQPETLPDTLPETLPETLPPPPSSGGLPDTEDVVRGLLKGLAQ
jgi:uncharacterized protein involved in outer membrane biogenesis